jgi:hypothetical protein
MITNLSFTIDPSPLQPHWPGSLFCSASAAGAFSEINLKRKNHNISAGDSQISDNNRPPIAASARGSQVHLLASEDGISTGQR